MNIIKECEKPGVFFQINDMIVYSRHFYWLKSYTHWSVTHTAWLVAKE